MIAALPMYARTANRAAHDSLWAVIRDGLRARGITAPDHLDHDIDYAAVWARDDLILGHICNLPYRAKHKGKVTLIAASHYDLPGCPPGTYNSLFVTRLDRPDAVEASSHRFACNDLLSHSGYGGPQQWAHAQGFDLQPVRITGGHAASIDAVVDGHADLAAIDAQTWWMAQQDTPATSRLKVIGATDPTPGMSFITKRDEDPAPYFEAISIAINALPRETALLNLSGIVQLPESAYDVPLPPMPAAVPA